MNMWIKDYFTEPLDNSEALHNLNEGSFIFWTRDVDNVIPRRGLTLATFGNDEDRIARVRMQRIIEHVLEAEEHREDVEGLLALAVQQDATISALHRAFASEPAIFFPLAKLRATSADESVPWADVAKLVDYLHKLSREGEAGALTREESSRLLAYAFRGFVGPLTLWRQFALDPVFYAKHARKFLERRDEYEREEEDRG